MLNPKLLWNIADVSYLKEQFKVHRIRHVCTLSAGALACNNLLHMLLYEFKNNKIESLIYVQKEDITSSPMGSQHNVWKDHII